MTAQAALPDSPDHSEPSAFERLVHTHQAAIWRYLRFVGCTPAEADDLCQDTFLAVVDRPLHRFDTGVARTYLRRVARNNFLKLRRSQRRRAAAEAHVGELAFDWFARDDDGVQVLEALRACLDEVSDSARHALTLRYAEQLGRRDIARHLGMSTHGVKSLLQRSYARLRACIRWRLADA